MTRTPQDRETDRVLIAWAQGDDARRSAWGRRQLVARHLGLVHSVARKHHGLVASRHEYDDVFQLGLEGLLHGVAHFDLSRDVSFATYVSFWIRHYVTRWTLPVKAHEMPTFIAAKRARRALPGASDEEVAAAIGVSQRKLRQVDDASRQTMSLDAEVMKDDSRSDQATTLGEIIADSGAVDAERALVSASEAAAVRRALARLPARQRQLLELRFGFASGDADDGLNLEDIGRQLARLKTTGRARKSLSRERVRQIEAVALARVRELFAEETR